MNNGKYQMLAINMLPRDAHAYAYFQEQAEKRGISVNKLLKRIFTTLCVDKLIDATLDDEKATLSSARVDRPHAPIQTVARATISQDAFERVRAPVPDISMRAVPRYIGTHGFKPRQEPGDINKILQEAARNTAALPITDNEERS